MTARDTSGCLTAAEVALVAADHTIPSNVREHLRACVECRHAMDEALVNERFLRELLGGRTAQRSQRSPCQAAPSAESEHTDESLRSAPDGWTLHHGDEYFDYRFLHEIHRGGQGIVYRAIHMPTGRPAAVKVLSVQSLRRRVRMEREAALAAALRHPNIVAMHACGEVADGRFAIAMDFVPGTDLDEWAERMRVETRRPRDRHRRVAVVMAAICDAVHHAHSRGVIHRDLKPSNVVVDENDEPRLVDFGVARRVHDEGVRGRVTFTGEVACTLAYAAPEQVLGDPDAVDARSDIYSLGVVLYELVTGALPYPSDAAVADAVDHIRNTSPRLPQSIVGAIDGELQTIILKCLSKEPSRRYESAAALGADLRRWLTGDAIEARRDSRLYVLRKAIGRNRTVVIAVASAAVVVMAGFTAASLSIVRSSSARQLAAMEEQRAHDEAARWEAVAEVLHELVPATDPEFDAYRFGPMHRAVTRLSGKLSGGLFAEEPLTQAAVHTAMAEVCERRFAPRLAEVQYREALRAIMMQPNVEIEQVAVAQRRLAELLTDRRSLAEARSLALASETSLRSIGQPAVRELALSIGCLAEIDLAAGDPTAALRRSREACELWKAGAGNEELPTRLQLTLARSLQLSGNTEMAVTEATEAVRAVLRARSDLHRDVAHSIRVLTEILRTGEPGSDQAIDLESLHRLANRLDAGSASATDLAALLDLKRWLLGANHADLVETQMARAIALVVEGQHARARAEVEEALPIARRAFGDVSLPVADLLSIHWSCCRDTSDIASALKGMEERLAILRALLPGKADVFLVIATRETAQYCAEMNQLAEADRYWEETFQHAERLLGPAHREYAWSLSRYAGYLCTHFQDFDRGAEVLDRAIAMLESIDPSPSYHLAHMRTARAGLCARRGDSKSAVEDLRVLVGMCGNCPEVDAIRGELASGLRRPMEELGDPECLALVDAFGGTARQANADP